MLKLQYFGHLLRIADSLEKSLMLGKIPGRRRRGEALSEKEVASLSSILAWEIPWTGKLVGYIQSMGSQKSRTQPRD